MNFLPKASGTRPRVACEIAPQGVTAARSDDAVAALSAVACVSLPEGALAPGLKPGNVADRIAVVDGVRRALEQVGARPNTRNSDITVVIPDSACRVLLLDFDALPNKLSEALPLVRFRLKKLLPFDADDAMLSFQIMSQTRQLVRVLAVAMPRDVLADYETAVREAGYEPGAVLPSTLAAMAAVDEAATALVVNVSRLGITTAIAREGILLLHRTVDLQVEAAGVPVNLPPALFEPSAAAADQFASLPLVDRDDSAGEWAQQQPLPEHGRDPYNVRERAEAAVQNEDGITDRPVPDIYAAAAEPVTHREPGALSNSPYLAPTLLADLNAEMHNAILDAPTAIGTLTDPNGVTVERVTPATELSPPAAVVDFAVEVAQAVSVAAAYFEDNLAATPSVVYCAGSLSAGALEQLLRDNATPGTDDLRLRELVDAHAVTADAVSARVSRGLLAGVLGALRG